MNMLTFEMNTRHHPSRCEKFRDHHLADYHGSGLFPFALDAAGTRVEKSVVGEYLICRLFSPSLIAFRRSWHDIRADKTNVTVFWFVRRGTLTVSRSGHDCVVKSGEFTLTRSSKPFSMELSPDASGELDVLHLIVPSHRVHAIISDNLDAGTAFPTADGEVALAKHILWMLFENGRDIDDEVSSSLVEAVLKGIGKTVSRVVGNLNVRHSIMEFRFKEIIKYINKNISNPDLSSVMVADGCGISSRYFCYVMKKNDLSFSSYVWSMRLNTAKSWLEDENMNHHSISEIGYMVGFKSSSHFSRVFKSRFKLTPRDFRLINREVS